MSESRSPDFIWHEKAKDAVYYGWLSEIDVMEESSRSVSHDDHLAAENALGMAFRLFPLIESVSFSLFRVNGRRYLEELGYSTHEANLMYVIFRNGFAHNARSYLLRYKGDGGEVAWTVSADAGSGPIRPHVDGVDRAFEYWKEEPGSNRAYLSVSRLAAQVRFDLERRRQADSRPTLKVIAGIEVGGGMPPTSATS